MNIFLTGATGFLGGEVLVNLSKRQEFDKIYCLIRSNSHEDAMKRLTHLFNLHGDYFDQKKVIPVLGNLTDDNLSQSLINNKILDDINIIVHSATNTSFSKIYVNLIEKVNIQGLKQIILWAKKLPKLETFLYVGTATICGKDIKNSIVLEEDSPNLIANHLVKYTYSKMMGEIMLQENLPQDKILIARPSIIMGDSREIIPRSTVILWALATVNYLRLISVNPNSQLDIIPVDYAADAMVKLLLAKRRHNVYHISSGVKAATNTLKITQTIESYFPDRPKFMFVDKSMISQMKNWAKKRLAPKNQLYNYSSYLDYWDDIFEDHGKLRILLTGLEPYLEFIELGQIFDNTKLLSDVSIENSKPAHEYIKSSIGFLETIDVFEGAIDP